MKSATEILLDDDQEHLEMKEKFMEKMRLQNMIKGNNSCFIDSYEKYKQIIEEVEVAKETKHRTSLQYRRLKRYDVMRIGEVKKLIRPLSEDMTEIKYFVPIEELFDVIHTAHLERGHGGRDVMIKTLGGKYANVTRDAVVSYLDLCTTCQNKRKNPKKDLVINPLSFEEVKTRGQVDIIDMKVENDCSDRRCILKYQDHASKFIILSTLKSKTSSEIVNALLDIFCTIGAPSVLQVDTGKEFVNKVSVELEIMWPDMEFAHDMSSQSQSQKITESSSQGIKDILYAWMGNNKTKHWSEGLRFCQLMINNSYHREIKQTPFEVMFGRKPVKMPSFSEATQAEEQFEAELPVNQDALSMTEDEETASEQSAALLSNVEVEIINIPEYSEPHIPAVITKNNCLICGGKTSGADKGYICQENIHEICRESMSSLREDFGNIVVCLYCASKVCTRENTKRVHGGLKVAEKKMKFQLNEKLPKIEVGKSVTVSIPYLDRNKMDVRNILGVVMHVTKDGLYKIGTRSGVLKSLYTRYQLQTHKEGFVNVIQVPDKELSLKEIYNQNSALKGQKFTKCNCYFKCSTNSCKCRKLNILCNSKCHHSSTCYNK